MLTEKTPVLDKLPSVRRLLFVGCEFNVSGRTIDTSRKRQRNFMDLYESAPESTKLTSTVQEEAMEKMVKFVY